MKPLLVEMACLLGIQNEIQEVHAVELEKLKFTYITVVK